MYSQHRHVNTVNSNNQSVNNYNHNADLAAVGDCLSILCAS